jgi:hypothetical protein
MPTITANISEKAHRILSREANLLATGKRLPVGKILTSLITWAESCEEWEGEIREDVRETLTERAKQQAEERRANERERKRQKAQE